MDSIQECDVQNLPLTDTDSDYVAKKKQFDKYTDADTNELVFPERPQDKCVCFAVGHLSL